MPSEIYLARIRLKGKLIRKSLKTDTLSVAKLRLADMEKKGGLFAEQPTHEVKRNENHHACEGRQLGILYNAIVSHGN